MNRLPYKEPKILIKATGCWEFLGTLNHGYGRITVDYLHQPASHYFWTESTGKLVPPGHELHHICENRKCVRPSHLECKTISEHRALHAEKRRRLLTEEQREQKAREASRKSAKQQYYQKKAQGLRRAKLKMPDGSFKDRWVPKVAGQKAVLDECLAHWVNRAPNSCP
jgi:hypothetical protein